MYIRKPRYWFILGLVVLLLGVSVIALRLRQTPPVVPVNTFTAAPSTSPDQVGAEVSPVVLPLSGPISRPEAEISGMAWYGEWLVLLPQYPQRFQNNLYAVARSDILAYLDSGVPLPAPIAIPLDSAGLEKSIPGYQGFEAIAFAGEQVFLTIEAESGPTLAYLVRGQMQPDLSGLKLEPQTAAIQPQAVLSNMSDESLLVYQEQIFTLYEANGAQINPQPQAHSFDFALTPQQDRPFPVIEYRITDAAPPDTAGRFWAINYFFPGDAEKLRTSEPACAPPACNPPPSHQQFPQVERLVQFQIEPDGIVMTQTPPVWLKLETEDARNWEALALLPGRGFLLASDKFPKTILAFVPYP